MTLSRRRPSMQPIVSKQKTSQQHRRSNLFCVVALLVSLLLVVVVAAVIGTPEWSIAGWSSNSSTGSSSKSAIHTSIPPSSVAMPLHPRSSIPMTPTAVAMTTTERCAINFFGLPRAFESLVLPSIIKHIIEPNDNCDYFVHYYHMTEEAAGRSGQGGAINPTSILLLKDAVLRVAASKGETSTPIVGFVHDTEEDFWKKYTPLIERIRTTKLQGKYLYFPWKARTYKHPVTTDNIVKMWHSIQAAFQLMEHTAASHNIHYAIAGMFRSDVVYITSIHLRDHADADDKKSQRVDAAPHYSVTIPNFGNHPISDRAVYGSTPAVKVWATERFARLEDHVHTMQKTDPGWGMHSERFLNATIFPAIRNTGGDDTTHILPHPTLCFLRARADETVWVSDCDGPPSVSAPSILQALHQNIRAAVEETLGRSCSGTIVKLSKNVKSLDCSQKPKTLAK